MCRFLMRRPGPDLERGERTHVARRPVDVPRALEQHGALRDRLRALGAEVEVLPPLDGHPDATFVEDVAVVLPELTVLARPGASRRDEPAALVDRLPGDRPLERVEAPATLEGGDVVVVGRTLLVGLSGRTDRRGAEWLESVVRPHGYRVEAVPVRNALHLKTACSHVGDGLLLVRPEWVDPEALERARRGGDVRESVAADRREPMAANALEVEGTVLLGADSPRTAEALARRGLRIDRLEISEFRKAEAGLTCLVLRVA